MTILLDTNVIVRHLTQDPVEQGKAASRFLAAAKDLVLTDVIVAETVYVLESVYKAPRAVVATAVQALVAMRNVSAEHRQIIERGIDLYATERMDFADAYLVAHAEASGVPQIASFDRGMDAPMRRASTVTRLDPSK